MRLVDIDSLKGCAIIRPTSSEEIAHIQACKGCIAHKDIPTAYDVEAVVAELEKQAEQYNRRALELAVKSTEAGIHHKGKALSYEHAISIVRGKE